MHAMLCDDIYFTLIDNQYSYLSLNFEFNSRKYKYCEKRILNNITKKVGKDQSKKIKEPEISTCIRVTCKLMGWLGKTLGEAKL